MRVVSISKEYIHLSTSEADRLKRGISPPVVEYEHVTMNLVDRSWRAGRIIGRRCFGIDGQREQ